MKKSLLFFAGLLSLIGNSQIGPGFTVTNTNGSNAITCSTPTLNFTANSTNNLTYVWNGPASSHTGSNVSISIPGTYTVVGTSTANASSNYIFTVVMNTFLPNSSISPTMANITCTMNSQVSFTANTSSPNCTHQFLSIYGGTVFSQNATAIYNPWGPGIYTLVTVDNSNGCSSTKQFTITSNVCFPAVLCSSPQNFSVGCSTNSTTVVSIITTTTLCAPAGPNSYTMIGPPTSTIVNFGALSNISNYTITTPGTWTLIARDNVSGCEINVPLSIIQNTSTPTLSVTVPQQILDCNTSQVNLIGSSNTANVSYQWHYIGTPGSAFSNSISVQTNTAAPSATVINVYTLTITDNSSTCKTMTIIPMYQNIFKPNAILSSGGNFTLNASTPSVVLVNMSTTGIPPALYPTNMPVIGYIICGPAPQFSVMNSSTFTVYLPGTYTLTAKDLNNGCTSTVSITMIDGLNLVGVQKTSTENLNIELFPNPNNGMFTLKTDMLLENTCVKIFNTLGVLVKKEDVFSNQKILDIQNESKGIFIIQVFKNDRIIYTSKIIKD